MHTTPSGKGDTSKGLAHMQPTTCEAGQHPLLGIPQHLSPQATHSQIS
ncbi:hypothetical protein HMPREF1121_01047 [Porphyromonas sp. KLE 1280]|nr:hypothetical protein HMPREF1121_01047 [Porphyromonas sp. KLE 1280]